jgi:hypothetical protein
MIFRRVSVLLQFSIAGADGVMCRGFFNAQKNEWTLSGSVWSITL